ncbi:MAG: Na+:solute symporter [Planctomycetes bacterium]|nr:Na+:solute symporter [Planctomycetota bacterium]
MTGADWFVVLGYLGASLAAGLWLARRGAKSMTDFFVSGRRLPWWLAGASMAATTFSVDTPLYVCGVVASRGIVGNWEWWSLAPMHMILVYVFARLWRRAEVVTDAELIELRYGGPAAALLRGLRAFLFAVPVNAIGMGYGMLAMAKVAAALDLVPDLGLGADQNKFAVVIGISVLTLAYAGVAGLWGVVATDFFQLLLALVGAVIVAVYAVSDAGGLESLRRALVERGADARLDFLPSFEDASGGAGRISWWMFAAYLSIQWWSFRRSDGGGEFIQRLSACRSEEDAEKAAWLFNLVHYVIRTWPWIVVGLASIVLFPELLAPGQDPELGYPQLMKRYLPSGLLGLVVASLLAAYMSTVSTQINWGASYVANDLYGRFLAPGASQARLVAVGRIASVVLTALACVVAMTSKSVLDLFRLVLLIGTGQGAVLILRWFWSRINAWAEVTSLVVGFSVAISLKLLPLAYGPTEKPPSFLIGPNRFAAELAITTFVTGAAWLLVLWLTPPESDATLDAFYRRTRPGGPGWRRQRERTGLAPAQDLGLDLLASVLATACLLGTMFAVGALLLGFWKVLAANTALAVAAGVLLAVVRARTRAQARASAASGGVATGLGTPPEAAR